MVSLLKLFTIISPSKSMPSIISDSISRGSCSSCCTCTGVLFSTISPSLQIAASRILWTITLFFAQRGSCKLQDIAINKHPHLTACHQNSIDNTCSPVFYVVDDFSFCASREILREANIVEEVFGFPRQCRKESLETLIECCLFLHGTIKVRLLQRAKYQA